MSKEIEKVNDVCCDSCCSCSGDHCHDGEEGDNNRIIIRLVIGFILFFVSLVIPMNHIVHFSLFLISYLIVGGEVILHAFQNLIKGRFFDENFLMSVASIGAFFIGEYPEGVAVMLFYQVGELIQGYAVKRSRGSISELMNIRPDFAVAMRGDKMVRVAPEEVKVGELIIVKAGEKIPLDGVITEGESLLDTSALTGESMPRSVSSGSEVLSGFVNKEGLLAIKVTKEYGESTSTKVLELVENANNKKAKTEKFITKFARYYTPIVVIAAVLIAFLPPLLFHSEDLSAWVNRALVFLVISCPCALVISVPISFFGGIGGASRNGVLVKGGNFLEALAHTQTVVFDKTGTLTKGIFEVDQIVAINGDKNELLEMAAYGEYFSNHPISKSIIKAYGKQISYELISQTKEIAGYGTETVVSGKSILVGNEKLMKERNVVYEKASVNGTVVYIALDGIFAGYISILDKIKEDSYKAIDALKRCGVREIVMLTGDSDSIGKEVASELKINKIYTELLPDGKVKQLETLLSKKSPKSILVFVGDGINDAPVLARADIGIAMGGIGSDAAIEAADIVIMTDEPSKIATAIKIARKTIRVAKQNIIFALSIKICILLLGLLGFASMWAAVFADVGVSVIAVLNAVRPLYTKKE